MKSLHKELLAVSKSVSELAIRIEAVAKKIGVENTQKVSPEKVMGPAKKAPKKSVVTEKTSIEILADTKDGVDTTMHDSAASP